MGRDDSHGCSSFLLLIRARVFDEKICIATFDENAVTGKTRHDLYRLKHYVTLSIARIALCCKQRLLLRMLPAMKQTVVYVSESTILF